MSPTRAVTTIVVLALGLLSACAEPAQSGAGQQAGPAGLPPAAYLGAITAAVHYPHSGISLAVPAAGASSHAAVSWSQAYANCLSGDAICDTSRGPTISLASATVSQAGTAQQDGSLTPLMRDTLVYVVSWTGVPCVPKGGPAGAGEHGPKTFSCTLLNFVDAKSGKVLYSVESPTP